MNWIEKLWTGLKPRAGPLEATIEAPIWRLSASKSWSADKMTSLSFFPMTKVECSIGHYVICLRDKYVTDCVTIWPKSDTQAVIRTIENPRIRRIRVSSCFPVFVRVFLTTNRQTHVCLCVSDKQTNKHGVSSLRGRQSNSRFLT